MKLTQPSFTGGEISPSLYARVDLTRYANSLKTCRNMVVSSYGGVYNRPGLRFVNASKASGVFRLIPFQFNTTQTYVIELGDNYARFYANGAQVTSGGSPVELVTPWGVADIWSVRYTQSADVMYLAHGDHPPQVISRVSASSFTIAEFRTSEGPFQPINPDDAVKMASSAMTGNTVITCNKSGTFTADMVGMFVYLENSNLSSIKPWTSGEKGMTVGTFRRNAGKTYRCVALSTGGIYVLTGGNAPQHDHGSQWDGPGDTRSDGTNDYSVGVLWNYVDSGYGIAKITAYTNSTTIDAVVTKRMPGGVIGGSGTPGGSWSLTGDGSTKTFAISGNSSGNNSDYSVTISGDPVQSDPYYTPSPSGPVDNCVAVDSFLPGDLRARDAAGESIALVDHADLSVMWETADLRGISPEPCWRIESASGAWLVISQSTRCETRERGYVFGDQLEGLSLPVCGDDLVPIWERIVSVIDAGVQPVAHIHVNDNNYLAGGARDHYISTHNPAIAKR